MPHLFKNEMKSDKILKKIVRVLIIDFSLKNFNNFQKPYPSEAYINNKRKLAHIFTNIH